MKVTYKGRDTNGTNILIPSDKGLAPERVHVPHGEPVELSDELAAELCEQPGWEPESDAKLKAAAKKLAKAREAAAKADAAKIAARHAPPPEPVQVASSEGEEG